MKSVILLGANQSGKSTLGGKLSEALNLPCVHAGCSPGGFKNAMVACVEQFNALDRGVIQDRATPFCERVYNTDLKDQEWAALSVFADIFMDKAVVIYCSYQGAKPLSKEYYPEGHYDEIVGKQERIRQSYQAILFSTPFIDYNWEVESFESLLKRVKDEII